MLEKGISHPKRWWKEEGRVLVDVRGAKTVLITQIAERLKASQAPASKKS